MSENVIAVAGVVKDYGSVRALHGVDLRVERGEIFGFIGPNGAGKSTTLRILLDLLRATSGTVEVLGSRDLAAHPELRSRIGYLPGELSLGGRHTARQHLSYLCTLRGGAGTDRIEPLAERFHLELDRPFRGLSKGNKQKVGVVQAFMHRPELLILDEPTSGLDPLLQKEFLSLARESRDAGATLLISSHILSEVEAVAGRVALIRNGKITTTEQMATLREATGQHIELRFAEPPRAAAFAALDELESVTVTDTTLTAVLRGSPDRLLKLAAEQTVLHWSARDQNLEELFLDRYRDADAPDASGGR